jgi:hypothetical protein
MDGPIRGDYEGLYGSDFLEKARENGDGAALEAIWRIREPSAARIVAEPLASLALPEQPSTWRLERVRRQP